MKLLEISRNSNKRNIIISQYGRRGFLVMEALIALALLTLLIPAALDLSWSNGALSMAVHARLDSLSTVSDYIKNAAMNQTASSTLQYQHEFGGSSCAIVPNKGFIDADIYPSNLNLNGIGTSLVAHDGFIYETVVPNSRSYPDFFIIDDRNSSTPAIVSSLVTGPGLAGIVVAGYYAYVANESTVSQLRVIDIHDRTHPIIIGQIKLPLPTASTTEPSASSIFYDEGYVYLGTQKWDGNEFSILDVSNPKKPLYVNGFKTGSLVNSIYGNGGYAYLALPATDVQMDIIDVRNPNSIVDLSHVAPAGSAVLEGKTFAYDNTTKTLYFGRSGGGFNNTNQYELFSYNLAVDPYAQHPNYVRDIPGGVYGIAYSNGYIFLATGDANAGFQIWKNDFSKEVYSAVLPAKPISLSCDHDRLYFSLSNLNGFVTVVPH